MPILLASYKNKTAGFVLKENKKQVTIGRDPGNDMPLPMTRVSKVHAALSLKNNQWFIRDLGSSNGTKLNNKKLVGKTEIHPGDRIRLGNVRLQFMDTQEIPEGVKRLKDRRDYDHRIRFKCSHCDHTLKAMAKHIGRRVQCHHCDEIVRVPGVVGKSNRKRKSRPDSPLKLVEEPSEQTLLIKSGEMKSLVENKAHDSASEEKVTLDDLHDELADVTPQQVETHKQAAKDQAQAMRQLRKAEIKRELFRDDRNPLDKLYSKVLIQFTLQYSKLKDPTFPIQRWHVAALFIVMVGFLSIRIFLGGGSGNLSNVENAPSEFVVNCSECNHESEMTLQRFEKLSFYMMHPDSYSQKYPGDDIPDPSVCTDCGKTHTALRLTVAPDTGQRRIVAVTEKDASLQMAQAQ
ncbi:MAG: hypothetical protein CMJ19_10735 [Phycisphaeraceae bacterium]|nr:hypothetical protein [Phycisphaeraceae bacterium]